MNTGLAGLEIAAGEHIGHFYRSREEAEQLYFSFISEGLRNGDICVCRINAELSEQRIVDVLRSLQIDVGSVLENSQLFFETEYSSIFCWQAHVWAGRIPVKRILRWAGDVTEGVKGSPEVLPLSDLSNLQAVALCQYDLTRLSGVCLIDAQVKHPVWVIDDVIHKNPFDQQSAPVWSPLLQTMADSESIPDHLVKGRQRFKNIVGQSPGIRKVLKAVETVAPTDAGVLLYGETGTGKELVVRSIHQLSPRHEKPLIKINCAALPPGLMESELFGHEKGSFTGALARKLGRFEIANGGTIFLDEIGDLQLDLQAKLLRVLQEGEFERVGGHQTIQVDVRVVAATNRNLEKAIHEGKFRADLFYRLNVFPIRIPPLRERKEDIPLLVKYFVMKYGARFRKNIERISQSTLDALLAHVWPGNIRELENLIERAVIICETTQLEPGKWLPQPGTAPMEARIPTLEELEKEHILEVLQMTSWRVSGERGAAKLLGMKATTLEARMKKLGISRF